MLSIMAKNICSGFDGSSQVGSRPTFPVLRPFPCPAPVGEGENSGGVGGFPLEEEELCPLRDEAIGRQGVWQPLTRQLMAEREGRESDG